MFVLVVFDILFVKNDFFSVGWKVGFFVVGSNDFLWCFFLRGYGGYY